MKYNVPDNPVLFFLRIILEILWILLCGIPSIFLAVIYLVVPRPRKDVRGEIVMVTGAGQGLGRELCLSFARLGAQLVCVDLMPEVNQETVKMVRDLGAKARGYVCDVSDRTAIQKLAQEVGRVDILVNNAGIYPMKGLTNATEKEIRTIIDINLLSHFWTAQAFLPGMKQRNHGHFVSISSVAAIGGFPHMEPYAASKAGIIGLTLSLAHEMRLENKDVKITTVYPYLLNTKSEMKSILEQYNVRFPPMEPDDAADAIVKGIQENRRAFSVPRKFYSLLHSFNFSTDYLWLKFNNLYYPAFDRESINLADDHDKILLRKENTGAIHVQE